MTAAPDRFAGWRPARVALADGGRVEWVRDDDDGLVGAEYEHDLQRLVRRPFNHLFRQSCSFAELIDRADALGTSAPRGLIFHVSRCGSTLVSSLLRCLPQAKVLAEAGPIDTVLRRTRTDYSAADRMRLLRAMTAALASGPSPVFIKLDAWSLMDADVIRAAWPQSPAVFLYREPLEVLVSQMRSPGRHLAWALMPPSLFGLEPDAGHAAPEVYFARVLAALYRAGLNLGESGAVRLINYSDLPDAVWSSIAAHFGATLTMDTQARMQARTLLDAKRGGVFRADGEDKRRSASTELRAAADRYLGPVYADLEDLRRRQAAGRPG